jgi:hypothetical protein
MQRAASSSDSSVLLEPREPLPRTRGECINGERPCPFLACKHYLYLDIAPRTGAVKINFPDLEIDGLKDTCSLDVADRGGETLEEIGEIMNLTRERVRQIEQSALCKLGLRSRPLFEERFGPSRRTA